MHNLPVIQLLISLDDRQNIGVLVYCSGHLAKQVIFQNRLLIDGNLSVFTNPEFKAQIVFYNLLGRALRKFNVNPWCMRPGECL